MTPAPQAKRLSEERLEILQPLEDCFCGGCEARRELLAHDTLVDLLGAIRAALATGPSIDAASPRG